MTPRVNFINILLAHFAPIFLSQKISNLKHSYAIFGTKILKNIDEIDFRFKKLTVAQFKAKLTTVWGRQYYIHSESHLM